MTACADLKAGDAPKPTAPLADQGYDSDAVRAALEARGTTPVIPAEPNRKG